MNPLNFFSRRPRRRTLWGVVALTAVAAVLACSDDPNPLGKELVGDILGSAPGTVFEDSIDVSADTTYAFSSVIFNRSFLSCGRKDNYQRAILLTPSLKSPAANVGKTVTKAEVRLLRESGDEIAVRFHKLSKKYVEGDSVAVLDTLAAIVDPGTGGVDRVMNGTTALHEIPAAMAQGWIQYPDSLNTGVAIVYTDTANVKLATFTSRTASSNYASLKVTFSDATETFYKMSANATFVRPTTTTNNLIVSDGFVRRAHFRVDLSQISDSSAVHRARVRFHVVPGSILGTNRTVVLYVPDNADPTKAGFLTGQSVTVATLDDTSDILEMPMTTVLLLVLEGTVPDNGFALRFQTENSEVRQVELRPSSDGTFPPRLFLTSSTPGRFDR